MNDKNENNLTDHILVDKILSGDTNAFSVVIFKTERLVTQIVFKMIANAEDQKDIAQDIYLKAFKKLGSFKFQSKLSTWIGQIAYNTCLNHLEKKQLVLNHKYAIETTEYEEMEYIDNKNAPTLYIEPDSILMKKELSEILQPEIDNLSPIYKTLITLYHKEELSYLEIAQITELPEGTVKNYLFRARKALKENLLKKFKKEDL